MPLTRERAAVELWWRNPQFYIQQCVEVGTFNFAWDSGYLAKRRIDHRAIVSHWARGHYWRSMEIDAYFAYLYDSEHQHHIAKWPVWSAEHQSWELLAAMCEDHPSESTDPEVRDDQAHVIIIKDLPSGLNGQDEAFRQDLQAIQEDYPQATFFIHGTYSMKMIFGSGFKLADMEPRTHAAQGQVYLHGGRRLAYQEVTDFWVKIFGLHKRDLKKPAERCKFNIEMLLWNATYWNSIKKFAVKRGLKTTAAMDEYILENHLVFTRRIVARPGDRVACDDCSLWLHCKYFREGAVCAVPGSEMKSIAEMFGTRDSSKIIEGLGKLLKVQVDRAESGLNAEQTETENHQAGKIDPALNKLMRDIESAATNLLELVDPSYRKKPGVQVNLLGGQGQPQLVSPEQAGREVTARAIAYLESQGFKRNEITADMVKNTVAQLIQDPSQPAIGA